MEKIFIALIFLVSIGFTLFVSFIIILIIGIIILTITNAICKKQEIKDLERKEQEKNILKSLGNYKNSIDEKDIHIKKINEEIEKDHFFKFSLKKRRKHKK